MEPGTINIPPPVPLGTPPPTRRAAPLIQIIALLPFLAIMLSGFVPLVRPWQGNDLDWAVLYHRFFVSGAQFGVDVGFTYGPWGFLWAAYDPRTFAISCVCWICIALATSAVLYRIFDTPDAPLWARSVGLIAAAISLGGNYTLAPDIRLMMLPALLLLYHFLFQSERIDAAKLLLASALGLVVLIKFTYLVAAAMVLFGITLDELMRPSTRRGFSLLRAFAPATAFSFIMIMLWLVAGQRLSNFAAWIASSAQITAGYAEVMGIRSVDETPQLIRALLALAAIFATAGIVAFRQLPTRRAALFAAVFFMLLVLVFRSGFVRHDYHEQITAGILLAMAPAICWIAWHRIPSPRLRFGLCAATMASTLTACAYSFQFGGQSLPQQLYQTTFRDVADETIETIRLARGLPLRQRLSWEKKWDDLAGRGNWPSVVGTVEQFPDFSPELLGSTLDHVARPTIKGIAAYTPYLSEMNARKLAGPNAIRNLLFRVAIFEQRMPTMDDNRSWPAILSGYDYLQDAGDNLHLIKRPADRSLQFSPFLVQTAKLNQPLSIPPALPIASGKRLLRAKIDFHRRPAGQLLAGLYRPPHIFLNIKTRGGSRSVFRIVPPNASDGFILGPVIERNDTIKSLLNVSNGQTDLDALMPETISVEGRYGVDPSWYFGDTFQIRVEQAVLQ